MTTRTFKQIGQAYGTTPATIVVKLDGVEIFNGPATTVDQPIPPLDRNTYQSLTNELFSFTKDSTFDGTASLEITVQGSPLLLGESRANYFYDTDDAATVWREFYSYSIDGHTYKDPLSDEKIDGVSVSRVENPALPGQWWWILAPGSVFTATMHIAASVVPTPPGP